MKKFTKFTKLSTESIASYTESVGNNRMKSRNRVHKNFDWRRYSSGRGGSNLSRDIFSLRFSDAKLIIVEAHTYHGVHQFLAFASLESAQTRGGINSSPFDPFHPPTWQFSHSPPKKKNPTTKPILVEDRKNRDRQIFQTILNKAENFQSWFPSNIISRSEKMFRMDWNWTIE